MKEEKMLQLNREIINAYKDEEILVGHGNINSPIILIGEAPGATEIEVGEPFVGQSGKYLSEFLEVLDINREDIYITNTVKYRPTNKNPKTKRLSNRTPRVGEINDFRDYLYREISIVDPKIIVTLGNTTLRCIFEKNLKIGNIHGKLMKREIHEKEYKVYPLYHPAAVIYRSEIKEVYIEDLRSLKKVIKETL